MRPPLQRIALLAAGAVALLCVCTIAALVWLRWHVKSDAFRQRLETNIGDTLNAQTTLRPLSYSDGTLRSSALTARGEEGAWFSSLDIEPIRADISFGQLLQGVLQVERIEAERISIDLSERRSPADVSRASRKSASGADGPKSPRVEVQSARVAEAQLAWDGGRLRQVALEANREGDDWSIRGTGGRLEHAGWPAVNVQSMRLRQRGERIIVERAELQQGATGSAVVDGEVNFESGLALNAKLDRVSIESLLPADWKRRLTGNLTGNVRISTPLPASGPPDLSGSLTLLDGRLEALPVLNELATFTQLAQFRTLALSRIQGDFEQRGERLDISKLVAESSGLLRLEGALVTANGTITGDFQVGLAPVALQWLPGARTKVFSVMRDGYCWAPMHLEGPIASPREDLSPRLIAAAAESTLETVRRAGESLPTQVPEAAKKLLDLFLGK